jgi:hypothetical protein
LPLSLSTDQDRSIGKRGRGCQRERKIELPGEKTITANDPKDLFPGIAKGYKRIPVTGAGLFVPPFPV